MINIPVIVAAFYRFAQLPHFETLREPLMRLCCNQDIKGTVLLAPEGINGTVAGSACAIENLITCIQSKPELKALELKTSHAMNMPFHRMKVKLKREIVTMGVTNINPRTSAGTYVLPKDWNDLISDSNTIVIDTRNDYEVAIGTFEGAIDPKTKTFREFPKWIEDNRKQIDRKTIAMFCTGGIRCEKATAFARQLDFREVYHLKGGILKYLEDIPPEHSRWQGDCFVFDERVSVGHGLKKGEIELCRACRRPVTPKQRLSRLYQTGISCSQCFHERSNEDRARYAERQRQILFAQARGQNRNIG